MGEVPPWGIEFRVQGAATMLALFTATTAFSAPLASKVFVPARATVFAAVAETTSDAVALETEAAALNAAADVLKASKRFGKAQVAAAQQFVEKALAGEDAQWLTEQKLVLFEQCQLDDEDGVCKELDAALTGLEELAAARGGKKAKSTPSTIFDNLFKGDPSKKAIARVKKAAAAFGPEQKKAADDWIAKTMSREVTDGGASLLNEQVLLFGECLLSEDGTPSKCEDLQAALTAMQEALGERAQNSFKSESTVESCVADPASYGEAPEGYCYDPWGRLILTKMGK